MINVSHFTTQLRGGAGIAAQRLHSGLLIHKLNSKLYYKEGVSIFEHTKQMFAEQSFLPRSASDIAISWLNRQCHLDQGLFTSPCWFAQRPIGKFTVDPGITHLHWVSRWIDLPTFLASVPDEQPIIWSLHDLNPMTGGCHHPLKCQKFQTHCNMCPMLRKPKSRDLSYKFYTLKESAYRGKNLHFVGNSHWTTNTAQQSALAQYAKSFTTIHLGVDVEQFRPVNKRTAKLALGIPEEQIVIGFGCADLSDSNKGFERLLQAITLLELSKSVTLLIFGGGRAPTLENQSIKLVACGPVSTPKLLSIIYSAADLFVVPSLIESFGLTALEAAACGTPVIAYATGGLTDVIEDGHTGILIPEVGDIPALAQAIARLVEQPAQRQAMAEKARRRVEENFTEAQMVKQYIELYQQVQGYSSR